MVGVNTFVLRQIQDSGKTFSESMAFDEIAIHAESQMKEGHYKDGYRDGVRIVQCEDTFVHHFYCPFTKITQETNLEANWVKRTEDEEAYIQIRALNGDPLSAGKVEFILYRRDVLAENNEQSTNAEWELISIHAIPEGVDNFPMEPVTMMRNQLELVGGTQAEYPSKEWAESVSFWQKYVALK
jgi:hypothetical protein